MPRASRSAAKLVAAGRPLLLFDTCTILDVMRDATRDAVRSHEAISAIQIVEAMEQQLLIGLTAIQVQVEFNDNNQDVENEAKNKLSTFLKNLKRIDEVAAAFGSGGQVEHGHLAGHVVRARAVVDRLMKASVTVRPGAGVEKLAFQRVGRGATPAAPGRSSIKDCVVFETYLGLANKVRALDATLPIMFVSSNTKDYTQEGQPKPDLAIELANINMTYCPNLSAARFVLGI